MFNFGGFAFLFSKRAQHRYSWFLLPFQTNFLAVCHSKCHIKSCLRNRCHKFDPLKQFYSHNNHQSHYTIKNNGSSVVLCSHVSKEPSFHQQPFFCKVCFGLQFDIQSNSIYFFSISITCYVNSNRSFVIQFLESLSIGKFINLLHFLESWPISGKFINLLHFLKGWLISGKQFWNQTS